MGCKEELARPETSVQAPKTDERTWPEGAVLAVGGMPIFQSDVDQTAASVKLLYPGNPLPSLRRKALTNVHLNRATLASLFPEQRDQARLAAQVALDDLAKPGAPPPKVLTGSWSELSLEVWGEVRTLEPGAIHGPVELSGRWALVRLDSLSPGLVPAADLFTVSLFEFGYVPMTFDPRTLTSAQSELTILNPAWESVVPAAWGKSLPSGWYAGPK